MKFYNLFYSTAPSVTFTAIARIFSDYKCNKKMKCMTINSYQFLKEELFAVFKWKHSCKS